MQDGLVGKASDQLINSGGLPDKRSGVLVQILDFSVYILYTSWGLNFFYHHINLLIFCEEKNYTETSYKISSYLYPHETQKVTK